MDSNQHGKAQNFNRREPAIKTCGMVDLYILMAFIRHAREWFLLPLPKVL
jgi:hypothetical protein